MAIGTTRSKRRLGKYIAPILKRSGFSPDDVAREVRCSKQSVYRLMSGDSLPRLHLLLAILSAIDVTEDERARALKLWDIADADKTVVQFADELPDRYMRFRLDEADAVRERSLDRIIVPGLLQTIEYAAELNRSTRQLLRRDGWEERAVSERRDRQEMVLRKEDPLHIHALIDETALRRIIGSRGVMIDQLDHLIEMTRKPNVTIQVLPLDLCAPGPYSGTMILLSYPESDEPDSVYVESMAGGETIGDDAVVATLSKVWDDIAAAAPTPQKSTKIIKAVRGEHAEQ
nr:helix-turn-helix transcriptional regulator [Kibdelosporangium sp. MJ126-NF4]CEL21595.1 Putative DNA-binding protein [Kibdelosporangium sp. MJ126-NF4]CTQ92376.1 Putative DNA-binding protein [Kibdelosporangium sp. MJ126-NF4]